MILLEQKTKLKKYVDESHITSSTNLKDEFRYLFEDVDDSSSEANISVTGIIDLANLPHTYNKKVYSLLLSKDPQNNYNALRKRKRNLNTFTAKETIVPNVTIIDLSQYSQPLARS